MKIEIEISEELYNQSFESVYGMKLDDIAYTVRKMANVIDYEIAAKVYRVSGVTMGNNWTDFVEWYNSTTEDNYLFHNTEMDNLIDAMQTLLEMEEAVENIPVDYACIISNTQDNILSEIYSCGNEIQEEVNSIIFSELEITEEEVTEDLQIKYFNM